MKQKRKHKHSAKASPSKSAPAAVPIGRKKRWVFRVISLILVPVLFFTTLELGLRCAGYGYSPRAIIKQKLDEREVYCHNYKFGWRFFPHSIARYFDGFVFETKKRPETYRIFVLGASAAMGVPAPAYNFGHMLELMLDEAYPDLDVEVHVVAMPAINSHAVVEIAKDCVRHEPDLLIVYLGNNEVVGPYGPGTVFAPFSPSLSMIRANIAMKSLRIGQLLEQAMQSVAPRKAPQQWNGLEMFLDKQIRYDDPALEMTYRYFEQNLSDICRIGLNSGASVIVSNVGSNLKDCPPFASLHRLDLTDAEKEAWQELYRQGAAFETEGHWDQALKKYLEAEQIDPEYAELQFRLGQCYWNDGEHQKAKEKFINAREYDTLRLRADNRINEIIRTVADARREERLYFVDSLAAMEAAGQPPMAGAELFYEHVHMTFKGNYVLAAAMLPTIQKALPAESHSVVSQPLSEKEVAEHLAYTDYDRVVCLNLVYETLLKRPPFTTQLNHDQVMTETKQSIDAQLLRLRQTGLNPCLMQYRRAVQNRPDDWKIRFQYAAFLNSGLHDIKAEETELRQVIKRCPYHLAYLNLGINLHRQANISQSRSILNELLEINPNAVHAHMELASICRQRREYEKEIDHLLKALSLEPQSMIGIHVDLANAYERTKNTEKAIDVLNNAIKVFPEEETPAAHALLSYLLYNRSEFSEALKHIQEAFRIDPALQDNLSYKTLMQNLENRTSG